MCEVVMLRCCVAGKGEVSFSGKDARVWGEASRAKHYIRLGSSVAQRDRSKRRARRTELLEREVPGGKMDQGKAMRWHSGAGCEGGRCNIVISFDRGGTDSSTAEGWRLQGATSAQSRQVRHEEQERED